MPRPALEVADIFRDHGAAWRAVLAACPIMAGIITFLIGHDSKIEMAGSRMMAG
jgi:hypothetical protein